MTDGKNPFEAMIAQYQEMAKAMNPALESFTPKGFENLWPTMQRKSWRCGSATRSTKRVWTPRPACC